MKRTILQIPMTPELKQTAEKKAESLGFSSLQEMVRMVLTQLTTRSEVQVDDICDKYGISYLVFLAQWPEGKLRKTAT